MVNTKLRKFVFRVMCGSNNKEKNPSAHLTHNSQHCLCNNAIKIYFNPLSRTKGQKARCVHCNKKHLPLNTDSRQLYNSFTCTIRTHPQVADVVCSWCLMTKRIDILCRRTTTPNRPSNPAPSDCPILRIPLSGVGKSRWDIQTPSAGQEFVKKSGTMLMVVL